jgi:hypothetical protein
MFAIGEDSDLGMRLRWYGWDAFLATDAVVYHKYSATSGVFSPFKLYLVERNHYWVAVKNFPLSMLLLVPFYTICRYFEQVMVVLRGHGSGGEFLSSGSRMEIVRALLRGTWHALLKFPLMFAKRRLIMKERKLGDAEMKRLFSRYRLSFRELLDID